MGARTFLEELRLTVATLQAAHPDRLGELARRTPSSHKAWLSRVWSSKTPPMSWRVIS